ncbi:MAG TPA: PLP-dependent aminotransferase family protein [Bacteroidales bacterium]|nr:PLP-dependent aminotransferase family protein [Bacteroidales bacterium]HRR92591.1 PLP-dependent aminotransferase family protein [Bacteroidales bacterium]HRT88682.1 PLP-dependent aminotransferase family protein [Bacteroidales bacterium]
MLRSIDPFLSRASRNMKKSAIREILKLLQRPGMISFAGGLPSPDTFPADDIKAVVEEVLRNESETALQYGTTEGDPLLRKVLAERHRRDGLNVDPENLIIVSGSQQGLDLLSRIFIDPDDYVICGLPSYLGGLNAFQTYGARLRGIPLDENGMRPDELEKAVVRLKDLGRKIKFIYLIPDFQNPTGITMPEARREKIIEIAEKHNLLIIEDSPYREIRFEGVPQKMMKQIDRYGRVISLCSFSKILSPGLRIGWIIGEAPILDKVVTAKQTADLCTSPFIQRIVARYIGKGLLDKNIPRTIELYRSRRDFMLECFSKYMPEGVSWTRPEGGLFLFVTLPGGLDTGEILKKAIDNNVAFVEGSTFFCNDSGHNTMRINFSFSSSAETETGVKRLAEVLREQIRKA